MPDKPRRFKEAAAAQNPGEQARFADAEAFEDVTVSSLSSAGDRDRGQRRHRRLAG